MQSELERYWINNKGMDISNLLRGKIWMIDEVIETRNIFERFEKLEKDLKDAEKGAK